MVNSSRGGDIGEDDDRKNTINGTIIYFYCLDVYLCNKSRDVKAMGDDYRIKYFLS